MPQPTVYERFAPAPSEVDRSLADSRHEVFWWDGLEHTPHEPLTGSARADLVIVGGGYAGLWTAIRAKERNPELTVMLLEARTIGWAASGRNGGFCQASITHGDENGRSRWPDEMDTLLRLGAENLKGIADTVERYHLDAEWEWPGAIDVAVEPYQVDFIRDAEGFLDQDAVRAEVNSPTYLAGAWDKKETALVNPAKLAVELARAAAELGVEIHENSPVRVVDREQPPVVHTATGRVTAGQVALATNVFPPLLWRNELMTVPVYDHVLATEPLSDAQLGEIGWRHRQGMADLGNQFHYYRLTADNRIVIGGYDANYHFGGKVKSQYEENPATFRRLASHFLTTFPQLEDIQFTHRWAGAIDTCSRFCAFFGTANKGTISYAAGFTGLGVGATRFAADVMLDLLAGAPTDRTELAMVREKPIPFPPEPLASLGINLTRWSLDQADHHEGRRNLLLRTLDALGMGFDS